MDAVEIFLQDNLKATIESYVGVGSIARVRLVTDRESGRSKGFAYVDVFQRDVADKVSTSTFVYIHVSLNVGM